MKQAIIYLRVSTSTQAIDGVSLEAQLARSRKWAETNGFEVIGIHEDAGVSGKRKDNRPGLQKALTEATAAPGRALIVYSLSRLARSTKDAIDIAEKLETAGADLVSLTERIDTSTAMGKFFFSVLSALSQLERDLVSERTKAALAHKASKGERIGEIPFGFFLADDGIRLEEEPTEKVTLARINDWRSRGYSWQKVADELNARDIATKKGRRWTWQTARKIAI